jgi:hypothetical protein
MKFKLFAKPTFSQKVSKETKKIEPQVRELIFGKNTIISFISFIIGGVLITNVIWSILVNKVNYGIIFLIGIFLFIAGGIASREFKR